MNRKWIKKIMSVILLWGLLIGTGLSGCSLLSGKEQSFNDAADSNLGQWGRALSAVLMQRNKMNPYYFGGLEESVKAAEVTKEMLENGWNIKSREDLLYQISTELYQGDRFDYQTDLEFLNGLSEEQIEACKEMVEGNTEVFLTETLKNKEKWGDKGILAWDMSKLSVLAQWGYRAGYISREEAHALIEPAAELIKEQFISWEEVWQNYLDSYAWWCAKMDLEKDEEEYAKRLAVYENLKTAENVENPLFDNNLFVSKILPVEGISYEDLLTDYQPKQDE